MLDVARLFELFNVDVSLGHCRPPAIICQVNSVAEPFNASLKDFKSDVLRLQLQLHIRDELLNFAISDIIGAWAHVISTFAQVTPTR